MNPDTLIQSGPHSARRLDRRQTLLALGAGAWAASLAPQLALAQSPAARGKMVLVMLRGALDGLAAVPPLQDPALEALRPRGASGPGQTDVAAPLPLDGQFALHPALTELHRWYGQGDLLVVHAVASHYRERSHFDAQQLLESGGPKPFELPTGWLGRALQETGRTGVSLTPSMPVSLRGSDKATTWTPTRARQPDADLYARLAQMYLHDPVLSARLELGLGQRALATAAVAGNPMSAPSPAPMPQPGMGDMSPAIPAAPSAFAVLARQAARFLTAPGGADVAWLEVDGWDTHNNQAGRLQRLLATLDEGLVALRNGLGEHWRDTTVLVMTEFGRSAAFNGTGGTDHGTGTVALVAGGAVAGGRVATDWPGLGARELLDGRDLRPTTDIRVLHKALLQRHLGLGVRAVSRLIPDVPAGDFPVYRT